MHGMDAVTQVARNLLAARERYGLTQEELSARSGVHPTEISRIEHARRDIQTRSSRTARATAGTVLSAGCV
jgi:transcriptional regulator with XRE-family HTH domain